MELWIWRGTCGSGARIGTTINKIRAFCVAVLGSTIILSSSVAVADSGTLRPTGTSTTAFVVALPHDSFSLFALSLLPFDREEFKRE